MGMDTSSSCSKDFSYHVKSYECAFFPEIDNDRKPTNRQLHNSLLSPVQEPIEKHHLTLLAHIIGHDERPMLCFDIDTLDDVTSCIGKVDVVSDVVDSNSMKILYVFLNKNLHLNNRFKYCVRLRY